MAVSQGAARGQDHAGGLAVEAEFLCRFHGRPDDQSRSRTFHGQADGRQDHRTEVEPSFDDLSSRRDRPVDPGSRETEQLVASVIESVSDPGAGSYAQVTILRLQ